MCLVLPAVAQSKNPNDSSNAVEEIRGYLRDASPQHVEETINKLVSFNNRSTLSSGIPADSGKGIVSRSRMDQERVRTLFERLWRLSRGKDGRIH